VRRRCWALALVLAAACSAEGTPLVEADQAADAASTTTTTVATTTTTASTTTTVPRAPVRAVTEEPYVAMSVAGPVTLVHPAARIEHIGFHESTHDGAQEQTALPTAVSPVVLESRDRGTGRQSAADVVVDPAAEIRSPVSGTVLRGGSYTLYCDYTDEYVVIEPDARPGWEVKVLHIVGLQVRTGDRVDAGETVLALHAHQLPFASQVDDLRTADPAWPHVHVEVVDPSVPDRPTGPGCS
jgi:biotin carboxyl carrier protein